MNSFTRVLLGLSVLLALTACGGGNSSSNAATDANSTGSNPSTPTNTTTIPALKVAASNPELETYLKNQLLELYGSVRSNPIPMLNDGVTPVSTTGVTSPTAADNSAANTNLFSTTTLQEADVEEADRVKTDGLYLYTTSTEKAALRVFKTDKASTALTQELPLETANYATLSGLYLHDHKLAVLGEDAQYFTILDSWFAPQPWQNRQNRVHLLDATNPEKITQTGQLNIDGQLINSRMIGSTLYLITRYSPTLKGLQLYPTTEAQASANRTLIQQASLQDLLPQYQWQDNARAALFQPNDCFMTQYSGKNNLQSSLVSLLAIDISNSNPIPQGKCFVGDVETVYASTEAVYLATTQTNYTMDGTGETAVYQSTVNTDIHKFALTNGIEYRGSGRVEGHLGWKQDLKAFRLSEQEGILRLFTSVGDTSNSSNASPAHLYTLQENTSTHALDIIGQLPNSNRPAALGKAGEQIYATRFLGKRGYLVTFRVTDPLYVIDLSNPADPYISGELKIDGYSDYLHPLTETLLLGIGKDAVVDTNGDNGRGAWYQGVKLALIDVSNPANPYERDRIILGKRGTETTVSQTHHALTTLKKGNTLQVALPVSLHETLANPGLSTGPSVSTYYNWTQDELYRLNIDLLAGSWQPLSAIISAKQTADNSVWSYQWLYDRSVMIGDYVHYLHGDKVISQMW